MNSTYFTTTSEPSEALSSTEKLSYIVRYTCLWLVILNNTSLCFLLWYKNDKGKRRFSKWLRFTAYAYFTSSTLSAFYNFLYRYMIAPEDCRWSDTIDEWLIISTRISLLLFYSFRVEVSFKDSIYEVNIYALSIIRIAFILYTLVMNILWISVYEMSITPYERKTWGVYCSNTGRIHIVLAVYIGDFITTVILLYLFVNRLYKVSYNTYRSNKELKQIAKNNTILTIISAVSTWFLIIPALIEMPIKNVSWLRWIFALDYIINGWCLILTFRIVRLNHYCKTHCGWLETADRDIIQSKSSISSTVKSRTFSIGKIFTSKKNVIIHTDINTKQETKPTLQLQSTNSQKMNGDFDTPISPLSNAPQLNDKGSNTSVVYSNVKTNV